MGPRGDNRAGFCRGSGRQPGFGVPTGRTGPGAARRPGTGSRPPPGGGCPLLPAGESERGDAPAGPAMSGRTEPGEGRQHRFRGPGPCRHRARHHPGPRDRGPRRFGAPGTGPLATERRGGGGRLPQFFFAAIVPLMMELVTALLFLLPLIDPLRENPPGVPAGVRRIRPGLRRLPPVTPRPDHPPCTRSARTSSRPPLRGALCLYRGPARARRASAPSSHATALPHPGSRRTLPGSGMHWIRLVGDAGDTPRAEKQRTRRRVVFFPGKV